MVCNVVFLASIFVFIVYVYAYILRIRQGKYYLLGAFYVPVFFIAQFDSFNGCNECSLQSAFSVWLSSFLLYFSLYRSGEVDAWVPIISLLFSLSLLVALLW